MTRLLKKKEAKWLNGEVRTLAGHTSWVLLVLALSLFPHFCSFCLHSFIRSPFTQPAAAVTDSQPTTSHWFQPSRGALHVSVHQFTAMAWMRSQIRDGLHSSRSSSSNEDEASSELLQLCGQYLASTRSIFIFGFIFSFLVLWV
jgi:hypothetical protein